MLEGILLSVYTYILILIAVFGTVLLVSIIKELIEDKFRD